MTRDVGLAYAQILILEDDLALAKLLVSAVSAAGANVIGPAEDIEGAMALILAKPIDAAILDLVVHGQYCDPIATELQRRKIPFAVTTGLGVDDDHPVLRDAPAITKPFQAEHVQDVLRHLLSVKR